MSPVLLRRRSLGDVVLLGAVTAALPGCTVVTDPAYLGLAARLRGVGRVVPWGAPLPPGPVIDLQGDLRTRLRWPTARRLHKRGLLRRLPLLGLPGGRGPVTDAYAAAAGVRAVAPPWIDGPGGEGLALIPGASTPIKRWSPGALAAVGRAWGGPVVVVGGPGEEGLVEEVRAGVPGARGVVEAGFDHTIEALVRCRVAVGGDTGLLHLAAACGARAVVLLGPTHAGDGFWAHAAATVSLALPCRPCTLHRRAACPEGHHGCMGQAIPEVIAQVRACASR